MTEEAKTREPTEQDRVIYAELIDQGFAPEDAWASTFGISDAIARTPSPAPPLGEEEMQEQQRRGEYVPPMRQFADAAPEGELTRLRAALQQAQVVIDYAAERLWNDRPEAIRDRPSDVDEALSVVRQALATPADPQQAQESHDDISPDIGGASADKTSGPLVLRVVGVSRLEDNERCLLVHFSARPADDDLRDLHEALAAAPSPDKDELCEGCPPVGYPTDKTRCTPCPRRSPLPADKLAELLEALLGPGDPAPDLGRFGWLEALVVDLKGNDEAMKLLSAEDPQAHSECMSEVDALIRDVHPLLLVLTDRRGK